MSSHLSRRSLPPFVPVVAAALKNKDVIISESPRNTRLGDRELPGDFYAYLLKELFG